MEPLKIDGSFGEGGGQIVRTALTLSCITGTPIRLENIRKNRKKGGLKAQHLTLVRILEKICNAKTRGSKLESTELEFVPDMMSDHSLVYDVGTAGSISLVVSSLIQAVSLCEKKLDLTIRGGTDVPWSPTIQYVKTILDNAHKRMGINADIVVKVRGYYPRGGGLVDVKINPCRDLKPIIADQEKSDQIDMMYSFSNVPKDIIDHTIKQLESNLAWANLTVKLAETKDAKDRGGSILLADTSSCIIGIDALYDAQKQRFTKDVAQEISQVTASVDDNLADMLVVPASITDGMSIYTVGKITSHLETNLYVASKITGCKYGIGKLESGFEVRIEGNSDSRIK